MLILTGSQRKLYYNIFHLLLRWLINTRHLFAIFHIELGPSFLLHFHVIFLDLPEFNGSFSFNIFLERK